MPKGNHKATDGRALWHRARGSTLGAMAGRAPDVDEMDVAAYLDGSLDEVACARVEAALASRPDRLELAIAAREALETLEAVQAEAAGPAAAPEAVVARAQALAPERGPLARVARAWAGRVSAGLSAWVAAVAGPAFEPRRGLALAGVAAGFLAVGVVGFELGRAEAMYSAEVDDLLAQDFAALIAPYGEDLL